MAKQHISSEELEYYLLNFLLDHIVGNFKSDKFVDNLAISKLSMEDGTVKIIGIKKGKGNSQATVFSTIFDIRIVETKWHE